MKKLETILFRLAASLLTSLAVASANAATPMVSAGALHTLALQSDGTVVAWGSDQYGQLGRGQAVFGTLPAAVPGLSQVKGISAGSNYMLAVKQDGTAWGWGANDFGQLGNGTTADVSSPVQVAGVSNAIAVSAGYEFSLALIADGTVKAWGSNPNVGIGTGASGFALLAASVIGVSNVTQVSAGHDHALALRADGSVYAWGNNTYGQIGDGTTTARSNAVLVPGLSGVIAVVAGPNVSAALKSDGTIWVWGQFTTFSSSGTATNSARMTPVQLAGISAVSAISGTSDDAQINALLTNGTVVQYFISQPVNPAVLPVSGIIAVAADGATLLLTANHTIKAFGNNQDGQIGNGSTTTVPIGAPVTIATLANVTAVAASQVNSMALTADGTVWTWGSNSNGQLGLGAATNQSVPGLVAGLSNVIQVSAGFSHSLALKQDGSVWTWGDNTLYELGNGSNVGSSTPLQVSGLANVIAISAGSGYSMAVKADGTVWGWGYNSYGELGDGTQVTRSTPVQIPGLSGIVAIAASQQTLALRNDGTLWAWGRNHVGQLGRGTTNPLNAVGPNNTPMQVPGLPPVKAFAAGQNNSYAVGTDGTAWAWGLGAVGLNGSAGVIGDGTTASRLSPVQITTLSGVVSISNTYGAAFALLSNGSVWGWGVDFYGQLGGLPSGVSLVPVPITSVSNVTQISAGTSFVSMLQQTGTVNMAGDNSLGELGDGTYAQRTLPVLAVNTGGSGFLDLNVGQTPSVSAAQAVPFFVASTGVITANSASVATTVKYNAQDQGKSGSVYITAVVPAGSLLTHAGALSATRTAQLVATQGATTLVTVQLTPAGWQPVSNGQLTPFVSGVLGTASAALQILNNTDTSTLAGAQFCVGYSTSSTASVTSRTVATIPAATTTGTAATSVTCATASTAVIPQAGIWWNPAEGGRGYTLEYNGGNMLMSAFLYDASGRSNWYGAGPAPMSGSTFSAPMTAYSGGQTLTGAYKPPTQGASPGNLSIVFSDASHGTMTWPGGSIPITRFEFASNGLNSPPTATQPQTGWWWNPSEGGRGFSVEVQNGMAYIACYMYDVNGNPVWYASGPAALTVNNVYQQNWSAYTGGQTLTGSYRPPNAPTNAGSLTIQFTTPAAATMTLPDGRQVPLVRFGF